jgi:hypothetical protein
MTAAIVPAIVPAAALHAGDRVDISLPRPGMWRRLANRIARRRPVLRFDAIVRVIEISAHGGVADLEACDMPGLVLTLPFGNGDMVTRLQEAGVIA